MRSTVRIPLPRTTSPTSFLPSRKFLTVSKMTLFALLFVSVGGLMVSTVEAAEEELEGFFSSSDGRKCVCSYDKDTDYFPVKVAPNVAENFDVEYFNSYKKITVKQSGQVLAVYYAYLCGTPEPSDLPDGAVPVEIPLRSVGVTSTTFIPFMEYIRQRETLDLVSVPASSVSSSCMQKLIEEGETDVPETWGLNKDDLMANNLDALFTGSFSHDSASALIVEYSPNTKPIYFLADVEQSPLGTVEWVEFASLFFNREEAAENVLDNIKSRFECAKTKAAAEIATKNIPSPTVLWVGSYYQESFYTASCPGSWYCEMLDNVDATLFDVSSLEPGFGIGMLEMLPLEEIDVVLWLGGDLRATLEAEAASNSSALSDLFDTRLKNATVFDNVKNTVGVYFQTRPAEPDVFMQDLVTVFLPDLDMSPHKRFYLRNVRDPNDLTIDPLEDACPDPSAPLFQNFRESACDRELVVIPGLDRAIPACEQHDRTTAPTVSSGAAASCSMVAVPLAAVAVTLQAAAWM